MHGEQPFTPQKPSVNHTDQFGGGGYMRSATVALPFFGGRFSPPIQNYSSPFHGVNFQPSEVCPRNFIICDQTDYRSQIMFHPTVNSKLRNPGLNFCFPTLKGNARLKADINVREASPVKEDSDDIDALLSYEEEEDEVCNEEEISTARTCTNHTSDYMDTCSSHGSRLKKSRLRTESCGNESNCSGRKRQKIKKMMKTLKEIVPGGNQMSTVTVLDEAVRYLKSLKVEVESLGVANIQPNLFSGQYGPTT